MARIGYRSGKYNEIDYTTKKYKTLGTAGKVPELVKVVDEKFAPEYNNAELYASDVLAESDYTFKGGVLTITVEDDDDTKDAALLGNDIETSSSGAEGEVTQNIGDSAPEIGYGHIVTKLVKGVKKYKVEFFPRVKVTKITTDAKTRGQNVEFGTTTIEAKVYPLDEAINGMAVGDWEKHETFTTLTAAETYLDACLTPTT